MSRDAWRCPCGCALQLDIGQQAREAKLAMLTYGDPIAHVPSMVSVSGASYRDCEVPSELLCRGCAKAFVVPGFVAEFVTAHRLRMDCEKCR